MYMLSWTNSFTFCSNSWFKCSSVIRCYFYCILRIAQWVIRPSHLLWSYKTIKRTDRTLICVSLSRYDARQSLKSIKVRCQLAVGVSVKLNHGNVQKTGMQKARLKSTAARCFTSLLFFLKSLGQWLKERGVLFFSLLVSFFLVPLFNQRLARCCSLCFPLRPSLQLLALHSLQSITLLVVQQQNRNTR